MNHVDLIGRLTRDPDIKYTQGEKPMCIARYTLAVNRRYSKNKDEQEAEFISCVAFGKSGEFAEKYFRKGTKIAVHGRIQTGSYTNKDGAKVYTTDVVIDEHEFCESRGTGSATAQAPANAPASAPAPAPAPAQAQQGTFDWTNFMAAPGGFDEDLPFT